MNTLRLISIFAALISSAVPAFAELKASLVTVSSGDELFDAFGHSGILIEDDSTKSSVVYEYSGYNARLRPRDLKGKVIGPIQGFLNVIDGKAVTSVFETPFESFKARYLLRGDAARTITLDALSLTAKEIQTLVKALQKDAKKKTYLYDNLKSNCATKIRDQIFALLPKKTRGFFNVEAETSALGIIKAEIDSAAKTAKEKVIKFPVQLLAKDQGSLSMAKGLMDKYGIKLVYATGDELYTSLKNLTGLLAFGIENKGLLALGGLPQEDIDQLPTLKNNYDAYVTKTLGKKPVNDWDLLFTPKQLRSALKPLKNSKNKELLGASTVLTRENSQFK